MPARTVFGDPSTERTTPLRSTEPMVNFLKQSTRSEAALGRAQVNEWYAQFPDANEAMYRRLRSTNDHEHTVALDELMLYSRFSVQSRVAYEEGGVGPDYRLYDGHDYLASAEVRSIFMQSDWSELEDRHGRIADSLNQKLTVDRWYVWFDIERLDRNPPINALVAWIKATICSLPPHAVGDPLPKATYTADGVVLRFRFVPRKDRPAAPGSRIVGTGAMHVGFVAARERLRVALGEKAGGKYDLRDRAYAVCVPIHDPVCGVDDVFDALYGSDIIRLTPEPVADRAGDGFFGRVPGQPKGKNSRVSCVFVVAPWAPWASTKISIARFDNPYATHEFDSARLVVNHRFGVQRPGDAELAWGPGGPPSW